MNCVYLIHLEVPMKALSGRQIKKASHYVGGATDLAARLHQHRSGYGAKFMQECCKRGIKFYLVRTWSAGGKRQIWPLEQKIKSGRNHKRLCPVCRGEVDLSDPRNDAFIGSKR